jgi:hypothetical protein
MTRRLRPEDTIQRAVFAHYNAPRAHDAVMFDVPNGGLRSRVEAAIMQGLGVTSACLNRRRQRRPISCSGTEAAGRLALRLLYLKASESMGNHDSKVVDADSVD